MVAAWEEGTRKTHKEALEETGAEAETHGVGQVSMITPNDQGVPDVGCPGALLRALLPRVGSPPEMLPWLQRRKLCGLWEGECRCQHQGRGSGPLKDLCVSASHPVRCLVNARQVFPSSQVYHTRIPLRHQGLPAAVSG